MGAQFLECNNGPRALNRVILSRTGRRRRRLRRAAKGRLTRACPPGPRRATSVSMHALQGPAVISARARAGPRRGDVVPPFAFGPAALCQ